MTTTLIPSPETDSTIYCYLCLPEFFAPTGLEDDQTNRAIDALNLLMHLSRS